MHRINKDEMEKRIDEVLFYFWDPIGVKDKVQSRAEYRSYVPTVLAKINCGNSAVLGKHLEEINRGNIGIEAGAKHCLETAELLLQHEQSVEEGSF